MLDYGLNTGLAQPKESLHILKNKRKEIFRCITKRMSKEQLEKLSPRLTNARLRHFYTISFGFLVELCKYIYDETEVKLVEVKDLIKTKGDQASQKQLVNALEELVYNLKEIAQVLDDVKETISPFYDRVKTAPRGLTQECVNRIKYVTETYDSFYKHLSDEIKIIEGRLEDVKKQEDSSKAARCLDDLIEEFKNFIHNNVELIHLIGILKDDLQNSFLKQNSSFQIYPGDQDIREIDCKREAVEHILASL